MHSPIEEGEIADDDCIGNGVSNTSQDNYEHLSMDIEMDSESPTKDTTKIIVNVDDADALKQLLLSQFNRKKTANASPSCVRRKLPAVSSSRNGGNDAKRTSSEDRRPSANSTGKKVTQGVSPTKINRKKSTKPLAAVEYTDRPSAEVEVRDAAGGELRTMQRQLRRLQRRLIMARNQKRKILKDLDDCETTIICCEREVGDLADSMSDVLRRLLEQVVETSDSRYSSDFATAVDFQSASHRRSYSPRQRKSAGDGVRESLSPNGNRSRSRGRIHRTTQFIKPINQLSPDKHFVASPPMSLNSGCKNALLDEKLRELELELAQSSKTSSKDVTNSNSLDEVDEDVKIDEEIELVVREELIDDRFDDETAEKETTLILTPPPPPPTLMEMERPIERVVPPDSTQLAVGAVDDGGSPADTPPDAEARELEILSRMVLRRTQVQVENYQREMAAAAFAGRSLVAEQTVLPPTDVTSVNSGSGVSHTTTAMQIIKPDNRRDQSVLGFWMTRKRARLESATASAVDSTTRLPSFKPPTETFCAEEQIQKFKKSISMAKKAEVRPSGHVGRTVVPRPTRDATLQAKVVQRELQSPLIFWHSYRLNQNFPFHLIRHPAVSNQIDPGRPLCPFELHGRCADQKCPWQHAADYQLTDVEIICNFLRINSLCPPGLMPENYARRLLEAYSVEDVARFLASKVPEAMRDEAVLPPMVANNSLSNRPSAEVNRVEYNSSLPHYLSANGMAKVLSE